MSRRPLGNVEDARLRARRALPKMVFDFIDGAADDEVTRDQNRAAFEGFALRPRGAVNVPRPNLATTVVGQSVRMPILLAPCGLIRIIHPDGEAGAARAAAELGTVALVSSMAGTSLEDVAAATPDDAKPWFQLYALGGREGVDQLVDRAQEAGYRALVVTIDTPLPGNRERDVRNRVPQPLRVNARTAVRLGPRMIIRPGWLQRFIRDGMPTDLPNTVGLQAHGSVLTQSQATDLMTTETLDWEDIERVRKRWDGPFLVKGVLTAEDAVRSREVGADAVIVSNHGGRQLDAAPATLDVLPEVVDAVGEHCEVLLDSGIRRGTDVIKALALGARAVLIGRPYVWGLAYDGSDGVVSVGKVLRNELIRDLKLLGCRDVMELDETWLRTTSR